MFFCVLAEQATGVVLGSFVLLLGDLKSDGLTSFNHLGADFDFLLLVANHNGYSLKVGSHFSIGSNMRVGNLFQGYRFFTA